jgi:hypothetical protein
MLVPILSSVRPSGLRLPTGTRISFLAVLRGPEELVCVLAASSWCRRHPLCRTCPAAQLRAARRHLLLQQPYPLPAAFAPEWLLDASCPELCS